MNKTKRPDMIVQLEIDDLALATAIECKAKELNITESALVQLVINDWIDKTEREIK